MLPPFSQLFAGDAQVKAILTSLYGHLCSAFAFFRTVLRILWRVLVLAIRPVVGSSVPLFFEFLKVKVFVQLTAPKSFTGLFSSEYFKSWTIPHRIPKVLAKFSHPKRHVSANQLIGKKSQSQSTIVLTLII
jgi:hypothetical protein